MAEDIPIYVKDRIKAFLNEIVPKIPNLSIRIIGDMIYGTLPYLSIYIAKFKIELGENVYGNVNVTYDEYIKESKSHYVYELMIIDSSNKFLSSYTILTDDTIFVRNEKYKVHTFTFKHDDASDAAYIDEDDGIYITV